MRAFDASLDMRPETLHMIDMDIPAHKLPILVIDAVPVIANSHLIVSVAFIGQ